MNGNVRVLIWAWNDHLFYCALVAGVGPELWLRPTGDPAEAANGAWTDWTACWSRPQHRSEPQQHAVVKDSMYRASFNVLNGIINCFTGEPMVAGEAGVWDNYSVKKQLLFSWYHCALFNWQNIQILPFICWSLSLFHYSTEIATNILLVDEIMRAGMSSLKG